MVVDASVGVAALVDNGPAGTWADNLLGGRDLAAPHLMPVEAANIVRRASLAGDTPPDMAALAHAEALAATLATLDMALSRASGIRCALATPPGAV